MPASTTSVPLNVNGVDVSIWVGEDGQQGGIVESATDDGLEVVVTFLCDYSQRRQLLYKLSGDSFWDGNTVTRTNPYTLGAIVEQYTSGYTFEWQKYICTSIGQMKPIQWRTDEDGSVTGLEGWGYYSKVIIPATFSRVPYEIGDEEFDGETYVDPSGFPYTTTEIKLSGEVFQPPTNTYAFKTVDYGAGNIGIIQPRSEITFTRHMMPGVLPWDVIQSTIGCVNDHPFALSGTTIPAGTLLVVGMENDPKPSFGTGNILQTIKWSCVALGPVQNSDGTTRIREWNEFLAPNGTWDFVVDKKGNYPYPYARIEDAIWPDYTT